MSLQGPIGSCLVVGAGMAGLLAANVLQKAGVKVLILEASAEVGGRMATYIMDEPPGKGAIFDHGAQFFTVRNPRFRQLVTGWMEKGLVAQWSHGFATADGSYYADGHARYRGVPDMTILARHLAQQFDVHLDDPVVLASAGKLGWRVSTANKRMFTAQSLLLTPPVPESLALLAGGDVVLSKVKRRALEHITYEPCIALLVLLQGSGRFPEQGGMWPVGEPIAWMADNYRKGVSPVPGAITIHAGPEFSEEHWETADETVVDLLRGAAAEWLEDSIKAVHVRRWPYSKPFWIHS